jgi:DNA primase
MITHSTIAKIMDQALIEEVVGDFVHLKKRGANLLGLCPFHNEKTPSFTVTPTKNIFKCFGCGKGGDPVTFLMEHEKFSYPEALRFLAQKYHIEIEEDAPNPLYEEQKLERESLYGSNQFAAEYFNKHLVNPITGATVGLSYFKERGMSDETIEKFQLGFADSKWDDFTQHALKQGFTQEVLVKAGLSVEEGGLHDKFRQRIIFPIQSLSGQIVGFGGRTLKTDAKEAKYLNTSETEIYSKSKVLYGLNFAKKAIKTVDECYLVEGYFDVIALHQAGIENTVATCGTSLTKDQIQVIKRFTPNVTLLYDGDAAGMKATLRAIDLILEENMNVRMLSFPEGDDPDSYIKTHGPFQFKNFVEQNRKDFIVFKSKFLLKNTENDPIGRANAISEVIDSIVLIPDAIKAGIYIKEVAQLFELKEESVLNEYNKKRIQKANKTPLPKMDVFQEIGVENPVPELAIPTIPKKQFYEQEKEVMRVLLLYGDHEVSVHHDSKEEKPEVYKVFDFLMERLIEDIQFENEPFKKIFAMMCEAFQNRGGFNVHRFMQSYPEYQEAVTELLSQKHALSENWEANKIYVLTEVDLIQKTCISALHHLKFRKLLALRNLFHQSLKTEQDEEELSKIQMMIIELDKLKMEMAKELSITIY